tara:strand:- start:247 stop:843 length:597 start_codon:yes stop_codon:yes gene_type:complete
LLALEEFRWGKMLCSCRRRRPKEFNLDLFEQFLIKSEYDYTDYTKEAGYILRYHFKNNYGASVIKTWCSIGAKDGLWELAIFDTDGKIMEIPLEMESRVHPLEMDPYIFGALTWEMVQDKLYKISKFPYQEMSYELPARDNIPFPSDLNAPLVGAIHGGNEMDMDRANEILKIMANNENPDPSTTARSLVRLNWQPEN